MSCDKCIESGNDLDNPVKHPPEECPEKIRAGEICEHRRFKWQCSECHLLAEIAELRSALAQERARGAVVVGSRDKLIEVYEREPPYCGLCMTDEDSEAHSRWADEELLPARAAVSATIRESPPPRPSWSWRRRR